MLKQLIAFLLKRQLGRQLGPQLIQRLSESYPIRRAARFTAYLYFKGKLAIEDTVKKQATNRSIPSSSNNKSFDFDRFKRTLASEIEKGLKEAKNKPKY